ncbi:MAG: DUF934 domain-containing protein [Roseiarcus sp.]|jgi:phosphoadenosine phosphosulfate reductase
MALWREGGFVDDVWTRLADGEPIPASGPVIVTAARWLAERAALAARAGPVGVSIAAGKDAVGQLQEAAARPLVVLEFAKFADGRAFSYAELLRERFGFKGELRAGGDVLLDEIALMRRCGFDSFEVVNEPTLRALKRGGAPGATLFYQPSVERDEAPAGTRPWLRRRAARGPGAER